MTARTAVVWNERFLGYDLGGHHPLDPVRLDLTIRLATELGVLDGVELLDAQPAPDAEIERIHVGEYLAAVRAAPGRGYDVAHGLGTPDNPVFERMHEASALLVGASLRAAEQIAQGVADRAVNIAGGLHHAMRDHAAGFCIYNDAAVAISWLLDNGFDRVAYVDVDVHHGDGVQAAFFADPRVLTVSLHQHPMTLFPATGYASELGDGEAKGMAVNLALPPGTRDSGWLRAFHAVVPSVVRAFRPQVLVTQCGVDSHAEDPLADMRLSVDGHRAAFQALRELAGEVPGGKWLALGGGGYALVRVVPRSWTHLLATMLDRDVDPHRPLPAGWLAHVARLTRDMPLPTSMTDGADVGFQAWSGEGESELDRLIVATRRAVLPLHGLDPDDPRD
jgi:acetoin utilization protein AcuC